MRVLLVDHDSEGLETIARAIRGVLELDCVTSKGDALLLLRQNTYDVLIACERAVDGSGLDLLGRTTRTAVPLKRIFAAAPERLQLLGPRLAPFKVQRTINYPIDLEELWLAIAQVTGGPNDETDGTIERVVLDERGIPASGTTPRTPIPPRPPAPLGGMRAVPAPPPARAPAPAIAVTGNGARTAAARVAQPVPEPPLRAPPPPRVPPPAMRQAAAAAAQVRAPAPQMRAPAPPMQPIPPMPISPPLAAAPAPRDLLQDWTPELPAEDDFAQIAAQARMSVERKVVDEAARRKRQRLLTACGVAVAVAGVIVFLIEKFYDPEARAREQAIAAEVSRMAEQQKVTDNLTLIEVDIENAIMNNELDAARTELAKLVARAPEHPRREFLQASIDRAAELQKFAAAGQPPTQPQASSAPASVERSAASRPRNAERVATRAPERSVAPRTTREASPPQPRTYGAPISEPPRAQTIPLDAPINSQATTTQLRRADTFGGRTVEASDSAVGRTAAVPAPSGSSTASGSAAVAIPPAAAPAQAPPPVDVVPAKIVKRVTPLVSYNVPRKTKGFVVVKFDIGENGRVSNVEVLESTPSGVFDDAATTAVRKWVYEPRKENGTAVASQSKARLVFDEAD
ncbi:MAG TPA: TonB family protein [Steroidobacteraceae bacterium]|nr:TonB family protein [Steroidobacteraceae bacterium]